MAGVQLVFVPRRCYGLSVTLWWYILARLLIKLFVSQCLIQAQTTVSRKPSILSKGNKHDKK